MRYAFTELGSARLDGAMSEYNQASLGLYCGKCGWKEEGRQRNWFFREGRYWDKIIVGVTNAWAHSDDQQLAATRKTRG